jgi:nicotinate-nucleotide adenylyltransferase
VARIGIYGGTFDPIHIGHLILAEQCREQCGLDEVWFVPAAHSPFKSPVEQTPAEQRYRLVSVAIADHPALRVSRCELDRSGPSWTVDTLEILHAENPGRELFLLMGADSLESFPQWHRPERIAELATIIGVNRGDRPLPELSSLGKLAERVRIVKMPGIDISATDIRERVRTGRSIRYLVPAAVERLIVELGLYRPAVN